MLQHMYLDFISFQVRMVQKVTFRPQQYHMLHTKPSCNLISLDWVLDQRSKMFSRDMHVDDVIFFAYLASEFAHLLRVYV